MGTFRVVIILLTIVLIAAFTWDAFNSLNAASRLNCDVENCDLRDRWRSRSVGATKDFDKIKAESDFIIKKAVFLNGTILLTGVFAFIALGKLQLRKKGK